MRVWSLASGSTGNCYLVEEGGKLLLLEAGMRVLRIEMELSRLGLSTSDVVAVLASHEHTDHWIAAPTAARRWRVPLICSPGTREAGFDSGKRSIHWQSIRHDEKIAAGPFSIEAFELPHDAREPTGFCIRGASGSICLATDMGVLTEEVIERASGTDLVILESNHDLEMLRRGPYPAHLKSRILGSRGHISNDEAARGTIRIARAGTRRFWLAHLSETNNSPSVALRTFRAVLRAEGLETVELGVALRNKRSVEWDSSRETENLRQLRLF